MLGGIHAFSINLNNRMICGVKLLTAVPNKNTLCATAAGGSAAGTQSVLCERKFHLIFQSPKQVLETVFILESRAASN